MCAVLQLNQYTTLTDAADLLHHDAPPNTSPLNDNSLRLIIKEVQRNEGDVNRGRVGSCLLCRGDEASPRLGLLKLSSLSSLMFAIFPLKFSLQEVKSAPNKVEVRCRAKPKLLSVSVVLSALTSLRYHELEPFYKPRYVVDVVEEVLLPPDPTRKVPI